MLLIIPTTYMEESDYAERKLCLPGVSRHLLTVSLRYLKQTRSNCKKVTLVHNSYQQDLAQRLTWTCSASSWMVNAKGWLQILVTVCKQSRPFLEVHWPVFCTSEIRIWLPDETAYMCSLRHCRDDKKGSELICIANSGLKVVITYAIINHEPSLFIFPL